MTRWEKLHIRLDTYGVIGHPVTPEDQRETLNAWLRRYCPNVKRQTGHWIHLGIRWHAYSYRFQTALEGPPARDAYLARAARSFLVYFESHDLLFTCFGVPAPLFDDWRDDLYVFPPTLAWTMIFTHELSMGLGPYFALPAA